MEQAKTEVRPVHGDPEARTTEPCDEHCDPGCVHHTPNVGWGLSFGSRINFHPVDTADGRMVVSLHLSDDAVATGVVYREVRPEQVVAFAQQLLDLVAHTRARVSHLHGPRGRSLSAAEYEGLPGGCVTADAGIFRA